MFEIVTEAISYSNAIAIIFASGSFFITLLGALLAIYGVLSAAKANREAKYWEYQREKRKEGYMLLDIVSGGQGAYIATRNGNIDMPATPMILAAAMLSDHPELEHAIKSVHQRLSNNHNDNWQDVRNELGRTIAILEKSGRS